MRGSSVLYFIHTRVILTRGNANRRVRFKRLSYPPPPPPSAISHLQPFLYDVGSVVRSKVVEKTAVIVLTISLCSTYDDRRRWMRNIIFEFNHRNENGRCTRSTTRQPHCKCIFNRAQVLDLTIDFSKPYTPEWNRRQTYVFWLY